MPRCSILLVGLVLLALLLSGCAGVSLGGGGTADVYFPRAGNDPALVLVNLYEKASSSIDVAIYSLTHPLIVTALLEAHKRGISVRVITDREAASNDVQKHAINSLLLAGVPVKINTHPGLMHLKMSVIDGSIATSGSYNYTRSASERNDEMLVVINSRAFAKSCSSEFERMWNDNRNFAAVRYE